MQILAGALPDTRLRGRHMFHGSIPAPLRSIIYEHAGAWPETDIYVGCSGNFTIERVLHSRFDNARPVHDNDITASTRRSPPATGGHS